MELCVSADVEFWVRAIHLRVQKFKEEIEKMFAQLGAEVNKSGQERILLRIFKCE